MMKYNINKKQNYIYQSTHFSLSNIQILEEKLQHFMKYLYQKIKYELYLEKYKSLEYFII